nr:MAG TPA: hypothetical protein [Caudoviricetes sp.]
MIMHIKLNESVNKLYKPTKLQKIFELFIESGDLATRYDFIPGEYSDIKSAQTSLSAGVKRYGYPIKIRVINNQIYLIRID